MGKTPEEEEVMQTLGNICAITACIIAVIIGILYFKAYWTVQGYTAGYRKAIADMISGGKKDDGNPE